MIRSLLALAALAAAPALADPVVVSYRFAPMVARADRTEPVVLSTRITGERPDRVVLVPLEGAEIALQDDGTGVYTASIPASLAVGALRPEDVYRRHIGFLDVYARGTRNARVNVVSQVWAPEMGLPEPVRIDDAMQAGTHVINVVDPALFAAGPAGDYTVGRSVARKTLAAFADDADFSVVVFNTNYIANRYHVQVANRVRGIGSPVFDRAAEYGSEGRLRGSSVFPSAAFFDAGSDGLSHELGHQWVSYLRTPALAAGTPHWPLSSMASDLMGFNIPGSNVGGNFQCKLVPEGNVVRLLPRDEPMRFGPLDLYLMGLIPASEVPEQLVFIDAAAALNLPCQGSLPRSSFRTVSIDEVVGTDGPRIPSAAEEQHAFRVAITVLSDVPLSREEMAFYDFFARRAEATAPHAVREGLRLGPGSPFFVATHGKARLVSSIPARRKAGADAPGPATGLWIDAARPGQGVTIAQRGDTLFVARFTYGADGQPDWSLLPGPVAGTFAAPDSAMLEYTVDGRRESLALSRFRFDDRARSLAVDYTDLWWDPGFDGTGVAIAHQGNTMFVVWFRDEDAGKRTWLMASSCVVTGTACTGTLFRTHAPGTPSNAGQLRIDFTGPNTARMTSTLDGREATRMLARFVF